MTQSGCAMAALGGLAASAAGQSVTLNFSVNASEFSVGDTLTWTVSASFSGYDDASSYFGGFAGSFIASDSSLGTAGNFQNLLAGEGTVQVASGADVNSVNIFNAALLGSNDPANTIDIFSFDLVTTAIGTISYDAAGLITVFPDDGIFTLGDEFVDFEVTSDRSGIPAPGAGAVLAAAGLIGAGAARRRR